jgi:hypothetical protein
MTCLFLGGGLDSVRVVGGTAIESTTASIRDATYTASAILLNSSTSIVAADFTDDDQVAISVTTGTVFCHFDVAALNSSGASVNWVELCDSAGNPWVAIRNSNFNGGNSYLLAVNTGTVAAPVWTTIGSAQTNASTLRSMDIRFTFGAPHSVDWLINNSSVAAGTFTQNLLTNLASVFFRNPCDNAYSQIMVYHNRSTVGGKVAALRASAAGSSSGFTGAVTDINEAVTNDANAISATSAGLRSTFAYADLASIPNGFVIDRVALATRGKNDGVAPLNIRPVVRSAAQNFVGANLAGIGTPYRSLIRRYAQDPGSAAAWTLTTLNAAEFGVESAA